MSDYIKGQLVRCEADFRDPQDSYGLVDPTTVTFKVKDPTGFVQTFVYGTNPQIVKEAPGVYYVNVLATQAGTWVYRFESAGSFQGDGEDLFTVAAGGF